MEINRSAFQIQDFEENKTLFLVFLRCVGYDCNPPFVCLRNFSSLPTKSNTHAGGDAFTDQSPSFATLQWARLWQPFSFSLFTLSWTSHPKPDYGEIKRYWVTFGDKPNFRKNHCIQKWRWRSITIHKRLLQTPSYFTPKT